MKALKPNRVRESDDDVVFCLLGSDTTWHHTTRVRDDPNVVQRDNRTKRNGAQRRRHHDNEEDDDDEADQVNHEATPKANGCIVFNHCSHYATGSSVVFTDHGTIVVVEIDNQQQANDWNWSVHVRCQQQ